MQQRNWQRLRQDLQFGIKIGVFYAVAFSLIASLAYVVGGHARFLERAGMDLPVVLAVYAFGGVAGGTLLGLLWPLRVTRWGSFCLGTIATIPLLTCAMMQVFDRAAWYPPGVITISILALVIGGGSTLVRYDKTKGWIS